ncbi:MAG: NlpC/P60 family protein [Rhizobiaceae bacterium]
MSAFKSHYVGIPWRDCGRTADGADCWGLARLIYLGEAGIVLPEHAEISSKNLREISRTIDTEAGGETWRRIPHGGVLRVLDLVVMTAPGHRTPIHVGVYGVLGGRGQVLHTEIETDAAWTRFDHPSLAGRVLGFWRHRLLDATAMREIAA